MVPIYPPVLCSTQRRNPAQRPSANEPWSEHTLRISLRATAYQGKKLVQFETDLDTWLEFK
jgi:hypothetical protein